MSASGSDIGTLRVSGLHSDVTMEQVHRLLSAFGFIDELRTMPTPGVQPPEMTVIVRYKTRTAAEAISIATSQLTTEESHGLVHSGSGLTVTVTPRDQLGDASDSIVAGTAQPPSRALPAKVPQPPPQQQLLQMQMMQQMQQMPQVPQQMMMPPQMFAGMPTGGMQQVPFYGAAAVSGNGYGSYSGYGGYGGYGGPMGNGPLPVGGPMGGGGRPRGEGRGSTAPGNLTGEETKLFVGGLPQDCTEAAIRVVFEPYGKVLNVHIMLPSERTGQRCAFVQYEMHACALSALELSNQYRMTPSGAPIVVRFADTQGGAKRQRAW